MPPHLCRYRHCRIEQHSDPLATVATTWCSGASLLDEYEVAAIASVITNHATDVTIRNGILEPVIRSPLQRYSVSVLSMSRVLTVRAHLNRKSKQIFVVL